MKKLFSVIIALCFFALAQAQTPIAMLNHGNTFTPFYGTDALVNAYNDAQEGDIITLSPGIFNGVEIRKPLTIRGAGMMTDTAAGTLRTTIIGTKKIHNPDTALPMIFEGLYFEGGAYMDNIWNVTFSKCYINSFGAPFYGGSGIHNGNFVHCIIPSIRAGWLSNCHFYNSVVAEGEANANWFQNSDGSTILYNCIIQLQSISSIDNFHSYNSILLLANENDTTTSMANTCENHEYCLGISAYDQFFHPSTNLGSQHLINYSWPSEAFGNGDPHFNRNISTFTDYNLMHTVYNIATLVGSDGTELGIYGGAMPFDPKVNNPSIGHITVGGQTNQQGQLPVNIQIVNE